MEMEIGKAVLVMCVEYDYELCVSKLHYGFTPVSEREVCKVPFPRAVINYFNRSCCVWSLMRVFILLTVKYTYGTRAKHTTKESLSRNTHHSSAVCTVWLRGSREGWASHFLSHAIPFIIEFVSASRRCGIKTTTIGLYDVWTQMATTSATSAFFGLLRPSTRVSRVHTP